MMFFAQRPRHLAAVLCISALVLASSAWATPLTVDLKVGEMKMANSSDAAELEMLRQLSGDHTLVLDDKNGDSAAVATAVAGMPGTWLLTDLAGPGYFALKFGIGSTNASANTFFFQNAGELTQLVWTNAQVQNLTGGACASNQNKCNIGRLSHYTTTLPATDDRPDTAPPVQLPEPGGIALLGLGLMAAATARLRRRSQSARR